MTYKELVRMTKTAELENAQQVDPAELRRRGLYKTVTPKPAGQYALEPVRSDMYDKIQAHLKRMQSQPAMRDPAAAHGLGAGDSTWQAPVNVRTRDIYKYNPAAARKSGPQVSTQPAYANAFGDASVRRQTLLDRPGRQQAQPTTAGKGIMAGHDALSKQLAQSQQQSSLGKPKQLSQLDVARPQLPDAARPGYMDKIKQYMPAVLKSLFGATPLPNSNIFRTLTNYLPSANGRAGLWQAPKSAPALQMNPQVMERIRQYIPSYGATQGLPVNMQYEQYQSQQ